MSNLCNRVLQKWHKLLSVPSGVLQLYCLYNLPVLHHYVLSEWFKLRIMHSQLRQLH